MSDHEDPPPNSSQDLAPKENPPPHWSAKKTFLFLFLPSLIFILFGMLLLTSIGEVFLFIPLFICPLLSLVFATLATIEFGKRQGNFSSYLGWGILWLLAHTAALGFIGFGGCSLIVNSIGYFDPN